MHTIPLFSTSSLGLRSPAFQTAFRLGCFRSGVSSLDSMRKLCNLTTLLYGSDKAMSTCRRGSVDIRQKLFQIICELVLIEVFLVGVVDSMRKPTSALFSSRRSAIYSSSDTACRYSRRVSIVIFSGIKAERLTRRIVSRIPFAVFNTVAASPTAAVAVPNISAIVDEREKVVARLRFAVVRDGCVGSSLLTGNPAQPAYAVYRFAKKVSSQHQGKAKSRRATGAGSMELLPLSTSSIEPADCRVLHVGNSRLDVSLKVSGNRATGCRPTQVLLS